MLILPDHATPVEIQTHVADDVPFVLWGTGFKSSGAKRFTEVEARDAGVFVEEGHNIMRRLMQ